MVLLEYKTRYADINALRSVVNEVDETHKKMLARRADHA